MYTNDVAAVLVAVLVVVSGRLMSELFNAVLVVGGGNHLKEIDVAVEDTNVGGFKGEGGARSVEHCDGSD